VDKKVELSHQGPHIIPVPQQVYPALQAQVTDEMAQCGTFRSIASDGQAGTRRQVA